MILPQGAPTAAATVPMAAENAVPGAFQPVLTALTQAMAAASTSPVAGAAMTGEGGSDLPLDGESLPPVTTTAPQPSVPPMTVELKEEVATDPDAAIEPEPATIPLFADGDAQPSQVTPAAQPAPDSVIASPTPPVSGDVKRPLPESTERRAGRVRSEAPAAPVADVASGKLGAAVAVMPVASARAESAPIVTDVSALADAEIAESPSVTHTGAVTARDNPLRAYQGQSAAPAMAQVEVTVGRPGWSEAVLEKVMWFSAQRIGSAEIHLNPAELGPLSVHISTHQDQASVYFSSHHAAVRDAVDQALPRLREMFDGQGIQLLDAGVGEQRHARHQAGTQGQGDGVLATAESDDSQRGAIADGSTVAIRVSNRLVDAYA
jgi:hypothetical protein